MKRHIFFMISFMGLFLVCSSLFAQEEAIDPILKEIYTESTMFEWTNRYIRGELAIKTLEDNPMKEVLHYLVTHPTQRTPNQETLLNALNKEVQRRQLKKLLDVYANNPQNVPKDEGTQDTIKANIAIYRSVSDDINAYQDLVDKLLPPQHIKEVFLVETDQKEQKQLKNLGLCPLYPRTVEISLPNEPTITSELPIRYSVYREKSNPDNWTTEEISPANISTLPCVLDITSLFNIPGITKRELMQLKTINQDEVEETVSACPTLALHNSVLMYQFALSGKATDLKELYNINSVKVFIKTFGCIKLATIKQIEQFFLEKKIEIPKESIYFLPTILLFNADYNKFLGDGSTDIAQLTSLNMVKETIENGLKQQNFFFTFIIGDEEKAQYGGGHYFSFSIIKKGTVIQYVVVDTAPEHYYLFTDSYEYKRLLYLIEMIERGYSDKIILNRDTPIRPLL